MFHSHPLLIIVSGPPASGKTTLAEKLSKDLRLLLLSKDDIKEMIWDTVGYNDAERNKAAWAGHTIIKKYAESMLSKGHSLIVEANFDKSKSSVYLKEVIDRTSARSVEVHCIAPSEVLQKRFLHRALHDNTRHYGHTDKRDTPDYHEKLYIKSAQTLGIADKEMDIDPVSSDFVYEHLLEKIRESLFEVQRVKIVVFVPLDAANTLRKAMGDAGAGIIGHYSHCSFSSLGKGRFFPGEGATPVIGSVGNAEIVEEERIEVVCEKSRLTEVIQAMKDAHPYEEVAFDVYELLSV